MKSRRVFLSNFVLVNGTLIVISALLIEFFLGGWIVTDPLTQLGILRDRKIVLKSIDPSSGLEHEVQYSLDRYGLRGPFTRVESVFVATVGGSNTAQRDLSDGQTFQDAMSEELKAHHLPNEVANAGQDGQFISGHQMTIDKWFPNIPNFRPKYVLVMPGANDFFLDEEGDFDESHSTRNDIQTVHHGFLNFILHSMGYKDKEIAVFLAPTATVEEQNRLKCRSFRCHLTTKSALLKLARKIQVEFIGRSSGVIYTSTRGIPVTNNWTNKPKVQNHALVLAKFMTRFEGSLTGLIKSVQNLGAIPIIVSPSVSYWTKNDGKIVGINENVAKINGVYINGMDVYEFFRVMRQGMLRISERENAYFIDLAGDVDFLQSDFSATIHFNEAGSKKVGQYLGAKIADFELRAPKLKL